MLLESKFKRRKAIIAYLISVLWFFGGILYFYFSSNPYSEIGYAVFIIYSLIFGTFSGLVALLLRALNIIGSSSFLYQLIGSLNIVLGLIGVYTLVFAEMEWILLVLFVFCWIWGIFITKDVWTDIK